MKGIGKPSTRTVGKRSEDLACRLLEDAGYRVVDVNYSLKFGEIDVIAWCDGMLCFVEVRSRSRGDFGGPLASVDHAKQRRIRRVASVYIADDPNPPPCRFDVLAMSLGEDGKVRDFELIQDAFW